MYNFLKRSFDILLPVLVLFILSPVLLLIFIVLKFSGEHEVFFYQERIGFNNKRFKLYKFVTMRKNTLNIPEIEFTAANYDRITTIGKFLRMTKLNEIPQFFNILLGDMTLVGPRPLIPVSFNMYSEEVKKKLYYLKPGLTGIGSIVFRGEEKLLINSDMDLKEYYRIHILPYKGALEVWYYKNKCLKVDLVILVLTFFAIFFPKIELHEKILKKLPDITKYKFYEKDMSDETKLNTEGEIP